MAKTSKQPVTPTPSVVNTTDTTEDDLGSNLGVASAFKRDEPAPAEINTEAENDAPIAITPPDESTQSVYPSPTLETEHTGNPNMWQIMHQKIVTCKAWGQREIETVKFVQCGGGILVHTSTKIQHGDPKGEIWITTTTSESTVFIANAYPGVDSTTFSPIIHGDNRLNR